MTRTAPSACGPMRWHLEGTKRDEWQPFPGQLIPCDRPPVSSRTQRIGVDQPAVHSDLRALSLGLGSGNNGRTRSGATLPRPLWKHAGKLPVRQASACQTNYCAGAQRRRFLFRIWSFKRSSVRSLVSDVMKKRAKHRMASAPASMPDAIRVIFQSIFKVPKKLRFAK